MLRLVAKDAPEQLPTGVPGNGADEFDPTLEMLMLGFLVGHMLYGWLEVSLFVAL